MKFTQKMQEVINAQVNLEMWSANLYLAMSIHFAQQGLNGFAHWYKKQSLEELEHAYAMIDYTISRGGKVTLTAVKEVPNDFESPLAIVEQAYNHECLVSEGIQSVLKAAKQEEDMATQNFFWKFIEEQVEEEANAMDLVDKIKLLDGHHLLFLDKELTSRA